MLPRIRKNLHTGEMALEVRCVKGCRHTVDLLTIGCLHENVDTGGCVLQTSFCLIPVAHRYDALNDLLWPEPDED